EKKAAERNETIKCFIQVNVSGEVTKHGLKPDQLFSFAEEIRGFRNIEVVGLMTMAPHVTNPEDARPIFQGLRVLLEQLNQKAIFSKPLTELSMGMSNDFEIAVEEGA